MTEMPEQELDARLAGIRKGPWSKGVDKALKKLAPIGGVPLAWRDAPQIVFEEFVLSTPNKRKSAQLERILRPHYKGQSIKDEKEIETRDAFDDALTIPQLYELAVQTGYLPEQSVRSFARSFLADLLWSAPARRFVEAYDYIAIPMLAARVGISGFVSTHPPEPNPNAALRFAGFLAHLRAFSSDEQIEVWLAFLDDFVVEQNEQELVWQFLRGRRKTPPVRTQALVTGCQRFVTSLATAFHILSDDEMGRYGLMHAYWLQKFFGHKRNARGEFVKNIGLWGEKDSWAQTFCDAPDLVSPDLDPVIRELIRRQFVDQVAMLERTFEAIKGLAIETRQPARRSERPIKVQENVSGG
jgi:hypothetical protein